MAPAAVQVLEETGYDIKGLLKEDDFVEVTLGDQDTKLYIIQVRGGRPSRRPCVQTESGGMWAAVHG